MRKLPLPILKKFFLILFFLPIFWERTLKDLGNTCGMQMVGVELREFLLLLSSKCWEMIYFMY